MIAHNEDTITITRRNHVVFYSFTVNIKLDFEFDLSLLIINDEAFRIIFVAKICQR